MSVVPDERGKEGDGQSGKEKTSKWKTLRGPGKRVLRLPAAVRAHDVLCRPNQARFLPPL